MKILLINTNADELKPYGTYLGKNNFTVLVATGFAQGVNIAVQKKPEIVVLFIKEKEHDCSPFVLSHLIPLSCKLIISNTGKQEIKIPANGNSNALVEKHSHISEKNLLEICVEYKGEQKENNFKAKKILLIEDNALIRLYFNALLDKLRVPYKICEGYKTAANELKTDKYDLVVSDVKLKDGNGVDLLHYVQALDNPVPFIIISGYQKSEVIEAYGAFESFAFITKPIEEKIFTTVIEKALNAKMPTKEKTRMTENQKVYDSTLLFKLLKNDSEKIKTSVDEYLAIVENGIKTIPDIVKTEKYDNIRPVFHDLLNLSNYFGAHDLIEMIMMFRNEEKATNKNNLLKKINVELNLVFNYYQKLPMN